MFIGIIMQQTQVSIYRTIGPLVLIFAPKHRLWVLIRTASPRRFYRVPTIYVLIKNKKNIDNFLLKIFIIYNFKNLCVLHGHVFVMPGPNRAVQPQKIARYLKLQILN